MGSLRCEQLDVRIGEVDVVNGLNLSIAPGEFWGLLGPNGIGKTTLLRCLAGLQEPRAGQVLLDSEDLAVLPRRLVAKHVGMLQQHTLYVFDSSVLQTALIGRHPHLGYWEREGPDDLALAELALQAVDLEGFAERSVTGLSGGEARRLAFASLLVQDPDVMLLDEPTNHLDLRHQVHIMGMIRQRTTSGEDEQRLSALAALHDINLAARYCSHVLMLFGRGEWCAGTTTEMLSEGALERLYGCPVERLESSEGSRFHPVAPHAR